METERKYNRGAKLILIISILAIPIQLVTTALISRVSAEDSGMLGILEIFYNAIVSFFILGGEIAIIKLLSDIKDKEQKKKFILNYIAVCIVFFLIIVTVLRIFNIDIIQIITGQEKETSLLMYIVALIIIINNILLFYIKESEKFIHYAIGIKLFNIGNLIAVLYIFFINKNIDVGNILLSVMGMLQLVNIIIIVMSEKIFVNIKLKSNKKFDIEMVKYIFFLYLSTIVIFIYDKVDQIIVVNKLGLAILGSYYLITKVVNMIKLIPNTYNSTFYPYICKELKKENCNFIFNNILIKNLLFIFPITIITILNSELIIRILLGAEYLQYSLILQILTVNVLFAALNPIMNNFLYAIGKSKAYFIISLLSILIEIAIIYFLIDYIGIIIIPISKVIVNICIMIMCKLYLKKMGYHIRLEMKYYIYNSITIIILFIINFIFIEQYMLTIISGIIILIFTILNKEYIYNIFKIKSNNKSMK